MPFEQSDKKKTDNDSRDPEARLLFFFGASLHSSSFRLHLSRPFSPFRPRPLHSSHPRPPCLSSLVCLASAESRCAQTPSCFSLPLAALALDVISDEKAPTALSLPPIDPASSTTSPPTTCPRHLHTGSWLGLYPMAPSPAPWSVPSLLSCYFCWHCPLSCGLFEMPAADRVPPPMPRTWAWSVLSPSARRCQASSPRLHTPLPSLQQPLPSTTPAPLRTARFTPLALRPRPLRPRLPPARPGRLSRREPAPWPMPTSLRLPPPSPPPFRRPRGSSRRRRPRHTLPRVHCNSEARQSSPLRRR